MTEFNSTCRGCQEFDPDPEPELKGEWWDGLCTKLGIGRNKMTDLDREHAKVKSDGQNALPRMVGGGLVVFHDYHLSDHGLKRAVHEICGQLGYKVNLFFKGIHLPHIQIERI